MVEEPGLPPERAGGLFLVRHAEYGLMLAKWNERGDCFFAAGFTTSDAMPFQMAALQAEQVPRIVSHCKVL